MRIERCPTNREWATIMDALELYAQINEDSLHMPYSERRSMQADAARARRIIEKY